MASKTRIFFLNALSLTATALIMRGVGMIFNVIVSNRAGSEAMGLYSMLESVYAFSITLGAAGVNLGATRLISEALGLGDEQQAKKVAKKALIYCTITSLFAATLLFLLSPILGEHLLCDVRSIKPLRILSLTITPIAICSCISGYFTAVRRVRANAALQIVAQFAKIGATLVFLSTFSNHDPETACIALVLGGAVAEFLSLTISYILYRMDRRRLKAAYNQESKASVSGGLLSITLPVTFSACIRSLLSMLQHVLIPRGLKSSGKSWSDALSSYGALHGMAMPLILFPSAFISSFAGLLIPEIGECVVQNNNSRLARASSRALTLSLIFSIGVSGIMLFFSKELGMLIYNSEETALYIRIMAPLIPVMYIDGTVDAILKGTGHQVYSMNVNIADALTACLFALFLIPKLGIWGYIISIYATEILNTTLSLIKMISVSKIKPSIMRGVVLPIFCIIGATNISKLILYFVPITLEGFWGLTVQIIMTVLLYLLLLLTTRTIGKDQWEFIYASVLSKKAYDKRFASQISE